MNTLNPAISLNQFAELAEQDGRIFFAILQAVRQAAKSIVSWWLSIITIIFLLPLILIFAQTVPIIFRKHLSIILPALPYIKERESLFWLKDVFQLYYYVLKGYRPFCLFRKSINFLMDEIDEHIDSLSLVLENQAFLQHATTNIEDTT